MTNPRRPSSSSRRPWALAPRPDLRGTPRRGFSGDERGQTIVIVGLLLTVLLGFLGLVADVGWLDVSLARAQRAADAAALAGAPYLPGNVPGAITAAKAEAQKNGFADGVGGATVVAAQDNLNPDLLSVTVSAPVRTWFARLFGINSFQATREARAEFILPVPMGSPQAYLGIHQLVQADGTVVNVRSAPNAYDPANPVLASQGFWAAVISRGGNANNGDAFSTKDRGGGPNLQYDPNGYYYMIDLRGSTGNGEVWLFDPSFCPVGRGASGTYLGTGDHWIGTGGTAMTTTYRLWDPGNTPYVTGNDRLLVDTGNTFSLQNSVDKSPQYTGDAVYGGGANGNGLGDCSGDPYHNQWYRLAGGLAPGFYHLQVTTSSVDNINVNAENMFGIGAITNGPTGGRVYGLTRMCSYNNVVTGTSLFYLAQIPAIHAGKTLQIQLHDPGDVGGNAYMRIKQPTPGGYVNATFNFTANGGIGVQSGNNVTQIQTSVNGAEQYDGAWITATIPLPANYGAGGLTPPGETEPGWWKIEYQIGAAGNDTITYQVGIRGNPIHLIVP